METATRAIYTMDTRQLRAFLKIAELGSITRAADALGIAQPSLSQQLLRLEDEVGSKLFRRTARGVATTEVGRIFLEYARHIVQTADRALEDVREVRKEPKGQVSFAMPISVSLILGVPLVETVLKHAPLVSLRLVADLSRENATEEFDAHGLPHDGIEPMRRMVRWVIDQSAAPAAATFAAVVAE